MISRKNDKRKKAWYKRVYDGIKLFVRTLGVVLRRMLRGMSKGVRNWVLLSSAAGIVLLITVIVLAVRLGGVRKELKTVQAMSASLQEELQAALSQQEETLQPFDTKTEEAEITPFSTVTSGPRPEPSAKYVVCVDAGHGDWDGGAVFGANGAEERTEKDDNLWMAKLFRDAMEAYGVEVVMTRETDEYLELTERTEIANQANADVLISFHRNSFAGEAQVRGVEFWIHSSRPEDAESLAEDMLDAVMGIGGLTNRGVKSGSMGSAKEDYTINQRANMASMIVELGFITSPADNAVYDACGSAYAEAMAEAVYRWLEARHKAENE